MSDLFAVQTTVRALDSPLRLKLLQLLAVSDRRVQELAGRVRAPMNLVSYHLRMLKRAGLVGERQSIADRRDLYYTLELSALQAQYIALGSVLHPTMSIDRSKLPKVKLPPLSLSRVLFLCSQNSARSQIAEALLRKKARTALGVFSAGTHPTRVHPFTLEVLRARRAPTRGLRSKSIREFRGESFDVVITVCDRAREECPGFPAQVEVRHWSIPDPLDVAGSRSRKRRAFEQVAEELDWRIEAFLIGVQFRAGRKARTGSDLLA